MADLNKYLNAESDDEIVINLIEDLTLYGYSIVVYSYEDGEIKTRRIENKDWLELNVDPTKPN